MPNMTDAGNAERLVRRYGDELRYCPQMRSWFMWRQNRWERDDAGEIMRMAKETAKGIALEAANSQYADDAARLFKWAQTTEGEARLNAMVGLAQSELGVSVGAAEWDAGDWMLNVLNGTLDLETGKLMQHDKHNAITKLAPVVYEKGAESTIWNEFLRDVVPDADTREFLQRAVGYSLTGDTSEEIMFFLHGGGCNGKSTFVNTIMNMLGTYADQCNPQTLMIRRDSGPRNDIARLRGMRFVSASEASGESEFDEELIKRITGADRVVARMLYQEEVTFVPTWKVWLMSNHRPNVPSTDNAIWRRIRLVPFMVQIPDEQRNPLVKKTLTLMNTEWSAVLAWAMRGLQLWKENGMAMPSEVATATNRYRHDMDALGMFISDKCVFHPEAKVLISELYDTYKHYCVCNGDTPLGKKTFGTRLNERGDGGVYTKKFSTGWHWIGIKLRNRVSLKPDSFVDE